MVPINKIGNKNKKLKKNTNIITHNQEQDLIIWFTDIMRQTLKSK